MENSKKELLTLSDVAELMGVHKVTICKWVRTKKFPAANYVINKRVTYWTRPYIERYLSTFHNAEIKLK